MPTWTQRKHSCDSAREEFSLVNAFELPSVTRTSRHNLIKTKIISLIMISTYIAHSTNHGRPMCVVFSATHMVDWCSELFRNFTLDPQHNGVTRKRTHSDHFRFLLASLLATAHHVSYDFSLFHFGRVRFFSLFHPAERLLIMINDRLIMQQTVFVNVFILCTFPCVYYMSAFAELAEIP